MSFISFVFCSETDAESWDPMAQDFHSADFNSYDSGVGALMQSAKNSGREGELGSGDINLFIANIPKELTKVTLTTILSVVYCVCVYTHVAMDSLVV